MVFRPPPSQQYILYAIWRPKVPQPQEQYDTYYSTPKYAKEDYLNNILAQHWSHPSSRFRSTILVLDFLKVI
jgi:hypothetical protein